MRESWKDMLDKLAKDDKIIACTMTEAEMSARFWSGFGDSEGIPFTAWSKEWVYFPATYDGAEWVERVPRDPCDIKTEHIGG